MGRKIEVHWLTGNVKGWVDVFPVEQFARLGDGIEGAHLVRGPKGGKHTARFRLTVSRLAAELDYRAFPQFNKRHGMILGVMTLRFTDSKRQPVQSLEWKGRPVSSADARVDTVESKEPASPGELAF